MSWLYVPGTEGSDSDSSSPAWNTEPWVTLSGTPTQRPHSWRGWKARPWIGLLSGLTLSPSTADRGVDEWISSLPASRVNPGPLPDRSRDSTTRDGCGPTLSTSLLTFDRGSCSWRTSQDSTEPSTGAGSRSSSKILPTSGSMRNGVCSPRPALERLTSGNVSGFLLWPTTTATDFKRSGGNPNTTGTHGTTLTDRGARMWKTPVARDDQKSPEAHLAMKERMGGGRKEITSPNVQTKAWATPTSALGAGGQAVRAWPTPRASDGGGRGSDPPRKNARAGSPTFKQVALEHGLHSQTTTTDGSTTSPRADLNPRFVAALMGLPLDWLTPCISVGTDSFREWRRLHSLNSHND